MDTLSMPIQFHLSCDDLLGADLMSKSDPFVTATLRQPGRPERPLGQTEPVVLTLFATALHVADASGTAEGQR